jgi:archaetidylinositol phosphate synthase
MVLSKMRNISEKIIKPFANGAIKIGLTPNKATLIGFLVSILSASLIFLYPIWRYILLVSAGLFFLAGCLDALDGAIARNSHGVTAFGGFLDSVLDRYSDAILIGCIIFVGFPSAPLCVPWIGLIALIGSLLVSYTRARAESAGAKKMAVGIAERGERMIILMIVLILQGIPELALTANPVLMPVLAYTNIGLIILAILTHFTVIQRIVHAYRVLPATDHAKQEEQIANNVSHELFDVDHSIEEEIPSHV